ncbi:MAG: response regulator transcription factor [Defluviitaleaceae bacterium]|nr:response regulator transcription factor [Defluviitaleaceae bacterium]
MEHTILICDDDKDILNVLEIYFCQENYKTFRAENGAQAIEILRNEKVHLVLLDVMMPVMDGIRATVKIREFSNIPIIFLSAKSEDTDRILGLNMGGDDYITKPFNPVELIARVKAALRRYARLGGISELFSEKILQTGDLILDDEKKKVTLNEKEISLTPLEYNILFLLMSNMEKIFSSSQIYEAAWNEPAFHVSKTVSVHIRNIREKIEINPKEPQYLKVVYGLGYKAVKVK